MFKRPEVQNYYLGARIIKATSAVATLAIVITIIFTFFSKDASKELGSQEEHVELQKKIDEVGQSSSVSENEIQNPHLRGVDKDNNPYSIKARYGYKINENTSFLKFVTADFSKPNAVINLKSETANVEAEKNLVDLKGEIEMVYNNDIVLNADNAIINYQSNSANGEGNVSLRSNLGTIKSERFSVSENYEVVIFEGGRVHSNLKPAKKNEKQ